MNSGGLAGGLTAAVAGALMLVLSAYGGELAASLPAVFAFAVPLMIGGVVYGRMVEGERIRPGFGHGILFWTGTFALCRALQELLLGGGVPPEGGGWAGFIIFQAMVGSAFGLGFVLMYGQIRILIQRFRHDENDEGRLAGAAEPPA
jgi:hypothetical protein